MNWGLILGSDMHPNLRYEIRGLGFLCKNCGPNIIYWISLGKCYFINALGLWQIAALSFFSGHFTIWIWTFLSLGWIHTLAQKPHQPHQPITWQYLPAPENEQERCLDSHAFKVRVPQKKCFVEQTVYANQDIQIGDPVFFWNDISRPQKILFFALPSYRNEALFFHKM